MLSIPIKKSANVDGEQTVEYDGGIDIHDAIKIYGEAVVYSLWSKQLVIAVQQMFRRVWNKDGLEAANEVLASWKPGASSVGGTKPVTGKQATRYFESCSAEELEAVLVGLKARAKEMKKMNKE